MVELNQLQLELSTVIADLKADSKRKLQLYNQAKALDGEIHTLEEREPILQHEMESSVQGLIEVKLAWAECKELLALTKKKVATTIVALMVTDIISASISLEQTQAKALAIESTIILFKPDIVPQETPRAEGEEQPGDVQPEETIYCIEGTIVRINLLIRLKISLRLLLFLLLFCIFPIYSVDLWLTP